MTLVITVHGREHVWLLVDRRLSYGGRRPPHDEAVKAASLETNDGVALLGYAGLGATPRGTEPSHWMSAVLRGRNMPIERALGQLADAATRELPPYLVQTPSRGHTMIAAAFIKDAGPRLYTIDTAVTPSGEVRYRYTRHQKSGVPLHAQCPRIAVGGTGGLYLRDRRDSWGRELLRIVDAYDGQRVSASRVADHLARLNHEVCRRVQDGTVGPRSIVIYKQRPGSDHPGPGGEHFTYTGRLRETAGGLAVPTIAAGRDVSAIAGVFVDLFAEHGMSFYLREEELKRRLAALPEAPDERLT